MASRPLTDAEILAQIPAARERERKAREKGHRARSAHFDQTNARVVLELTSGVVFAFPVRIIPALENATSTELDAVTLSPSGSALRWDSLDVDLSVAGLLLSAVDPVERVRYLASVAGSATSKSKAHAARLNGAKGGRPRKTTASKKTVSRRNPSV